MKNLQKGFTLIELMIVVAIIGILAMFALPAYQDYTRRTHVAEGLTLAASAKSAITEYYASEGQWPTDNTEAGIAAPSDIKGNAVTGILIKATPTEKYADIYVGYNQKVTGNSSNVVVPSAGTETNAVRIQAHAADVNAASFEWTCGPVDTTVIPMKLMPTSCRATTFS